MIAWDGDPGATDIHYRSIRSEQEMNVVPLLTNLTNPSPPLGWAHTERRSFVDRSKADVTLALALAHHLTIGANIRLEMIADLFAQLAPKLIIEFVPDTDPMVQRLLRTRDDVQPYLAIQGFRDVLERHFEIVEDIPIEDSGRRILLLTRR